MEENNSSSNQPPVPISSPGETVPTPAPTISKHKLKLPILITVALLFLILAIVLSEFLTNFSKPFPIYFGKSNMNNSLVNQNNIPKKQTTDTMLPTGVVASYSDFMDYSVPIGWVRDDAHGVFTSPDFQIGDPHTQGIGIWLGLAPNYNNYTIESLEKETKAASGRQTSDFIDTTIDGVPAFTFHEENSNPSAPHSLNYYTIKNGYILSIEFITTNLKTEQAFQGEISKFISSIHFGRNEPRTWSVLKSFTDSKGNKKYIVYVTYNVAGQWYYYLSNSSQKNSQAKKITTATNLGPTASNIGPYVSGNPGTKYLVLFQGAGDGTFFAIADENGNVIGNQITLGTIGVTKGQAGLSFGQWIGDTTNFTLVAHVADGSKYEATFDASTGKQVGTTKQIK